MGPNWCPTNAKSVPKYCSEVDAAQLVPQKCKNTAQWCRNGTHWNTTGARIVVKGWSNNRFALYGIQGAYIIIPWCQAGAPWCALGHQSDSHGGQTLTKWHWNSYSTSYQILIKINRPWWGALYVSVWGLKSTTTPGE